jgi:hypothetical protein
MLPTPFWLLWILLTVIQLVGLTVLFNDWPLSDRFRGGVVEFFGFAQTLIQAFDLLSLSFLL